MYCKERSTLLLLALGSVPVYFLAAVVIARQDEQGEQNNHTCA